MTTLPTSLPRTRALSRRTASSSLLTPAGERVAHSDPYADALDADRLRAMYRDMVLARRFDTEATSLQRQGEPGAVGAGAGPGGGAGRFRARRP